MGFDQLAVCSMSHDWVGRRFRPGLTPKCEPVGNHNNRRVIHERSNTSGRCPEFYLDWDSEGSGGLPRSTYTRM
jgi:hypothetical protein